jgi:Kef-type K+ transport system membrane component KefB
MGRRLGSLLLFVCGYLAMASLAPLTALAPALLSFFAGVLVLAREPRGQPQPSRR